MIRVTFYEGEPDDREEQLAVADLEAVPREGDYIVLSVPQGSAEYMVGDVRWYVADVNLNVPGLAERVSVYLTRV